MDQNQIKHLEGGTFRINLVGTLVEVNRHKHEARLFSQPLQPI